jgi:hypothetical protein
MSVIDPTYLRNIYDSLLSNTLHKDNASALPLGLEGIYEEYLPPACCVKERQEFLDFFSAWALLKKEVSAAFVSQLLGWTVEYVMDYISEYSKWFNAPLTGKYTLYHERLRSFVLQKISHAKFTDCNEDVISLGKEALRKRSYDELEQYALEYQSTHMLIQAMETGSLDLLKELAYNTAHWTRQIEISKGFEWSKCMLNDVMLCASKFEEDEAVECALNIVDLYQMEQNDAPRIVELVAKNDVEAALQRIESFGGNDEDGFQRKFLLYMLCLMDLTLSESKIKPHRKGAIEKLLCHLDEQLPTDHSILKWNNFFPSFMMFQIVCELAEMGLDYLVVYKRTDDWENEWIAKKGPYNSLQLEVLLKCAHAINDNLNKCTTLKLISAELSKNGRVAEAVIAIQEAISSARLISDDYWKSSALNIISSELAEQGRMEEAAYTLQESMTCIQGLSDSDKQSAFGAISIELVKQGKIEEAQACILGITSSYHKDAALSAFSVGLAKQGKFDDSLAIAHGIGDVERGFAFATISTELCERGRVFEASLAIQEALTCARRTWPSNLKISALSSISTELSKQGRTEEVSSTIEEAFFHARAESNQYDKCFRLLSIIAELEVQGQFEAVSTAMQEVLIIAHEIRDDYRKSTALKAISVEMFKQGQMEFAATTLKEAFACVPKSNKRLLISFSAEFVNQGQIEEAIFAIQEVLACARGVREDWEKSTILCAISIELAKQGLFEEAVACVSFIINDGDKHDTIKEISVELVKRAKMEEALIVINDITDNYYKSNALQAISFELLKQGRIKEALVSARDIDSDYYRSLGLKFIGAELAKQGQKEEGASAVKEALVLAHATEEDSAKSTALSVISTELRNQGLVIESATAMQGALQCASRIKNVYHKWDSLKDISVELVKQEKMEEALIVINDITDNYCKSTALQAISVELLKKGQMNEALVCISIVDEDYYKSTALSAVSAELAKQGQIEVALVCARGISDDYDKSTALQAISVELAKRGKFDLAEKTGLEIPQIAKRNDCWQEIAKVALEKGAWNLPLNRFHDYKSYEARMFYLKGWSNHVAVEDVSAVCVAEALPIIAGDIESMKALLQKYAWQEIFFGNLDIKLQLRLNSTLDIQWAIDIKQSINVN